MGLSIPSCNEASSRHLTSTVMTTPVAVSSCTSTTGLSTFLSRLKILAIAVVIVAISYHGRHRQEQVSVTKVMGRVSIESVPSHPEAKEQLRVTPRKTIKVTSDASCDQLLTSGRFVSKDTWQPYGCLMHNYTTGEAKQCLKSRAVANKDITRILYVGDSRLKQATSRLLQQLGVSADVRSKVHALRKPKQFHYNITDLGFQMNFHHLSTMDEQTAVNLVNQYRKQPPTLIVLGAVLHYILDYKAKSRKEGIPAYQAGITRFAEEVKSLPPTTTIIYRLTEPFNTSNIINKHPFKRNDDIDLYNAAALKVFNNSRVKMWHSSHSLHIQRLWDYTDGIHANNSTMIYDVQMILNLLCNRHMPSLPSNVCCSYRTETPTTDSEHVNKDLSTTVTAPTLLTKSLTSTNNLYILPTMVVVIVIISIIIQGWPTLQRVSMCRVWCRRGGEAAANLEDQSHLIANPTKILHGQQNGLSKTNSTIEMDHQLEERTADLRRILWLLLKLVVILSYFFLCDKIDFFEKSSKEFSLLHFGAPLLVVTCAAAFSITTTKSTGVDQILSRDVTDEWKGWMQFVLLVYHASGASKNLPIYMHVRVIVSSYLFLTGYGHFSRYWKTGNAGGSTRYWQVMYRLNFLTVLLCLVMEQPYMNYYFVVLVSFWYTVLHVVLALPPHLTKSGLERTLADFGRAVFKIVVVALTITVVTNFKVFELTFGSSQLKNVFQLPTLDGLREWRFRWMLDRFSVLYGMIFAFMCQAWTHFWPHNSIGSSWPSTKWGSALLAALSLSSFACYPLLLQKCDTKRACNDLHPYFTWIPILGYIFFRHRCSFFRSHFSTLFAFLGQISLELFISQYHILLTSNTHSLLVLVPGQPIINTVVTGLVFLCSAHEISNITGHLQPTLAPSDLKKITRNILVGGVCLLLFSYGDWMEYFDFQSPIVVK